MQAFDRQTNKQTDDGQNSHR